MILVGFCYVHVWQCIFIFMVALFLLSQCTTSLLLSLRDDRSNSDVIMKGAYVADDLVLLRLGRARR